MGKMSMRAFFTVASAVLLAVSLGETAAADGKGRLVGTWNVTLKFPTCSATCPCPGGVPNIPVPALHSYQAHGSFVEIAGGTLLRGPGAGSWKRTEDQKFEVRFKFFLFNPDGTRRGSEEVTNEIELTGPDSFEASATFDLFDATGTVIGQGCAINETATRFE
jgi:hypothetical protein